jgi:ABC-2 type transport system ATP-binding protein
MSDRAETRGSVEAGRALMVRNVVKRFGPTMALDHAGLELRRGERLALLGPNGAGKTTLVRCISGRAVPDAGEIEMLGRRMPPSGGRHELGFVPQEIALYPDLTARENLEAFGRFHGLKGGKLRQAVDWALDWTSLADRAGDLTKTYSSGMKRRVNIACGVLHRPLILLLDEPHQLEEAEQRCDRIVIIDHGHAIAEGTLTELIASTVGAKRKVVFKLAEACPKLDGMTTDGDRRELVAEVEDVALELPDLLIRIRESGGRVCDLEVHAPSLHSVFIHLTGRELRE